MSTTDIIKAQIALSCRTQKLKILKYAGILLRLVAEEKDLVRTRLKTNTGMVREDRKERYYTNISAIEKTIRRTYRSVLFKHLIEVSKSSAKEKVSPFYNIDKVLGLYKVAAIQLQEDIQIRVLSSEEAVNLNFKLTRRSNRAFVPSDFPELGIIDEIKQLSYFSHYNIWQSVSQFGVYAYC